jgi:2-oxoglutarate dehydrogenase E2 component (dihydrolipoamide succinyltransferase)
MFDVVVPKLNNNDEACLLRTWLVADGGRVEADEIVAILETSKATFDLVSERAGVLCQLVTAGTECRFETVIAHLFAGDEERRAFLAERAAAGGSGGSGSSSTLTVTRGARELMAEHGIDESRLLALGKSVIKRSDVEALLASAPAGETEDVFEPLPRRQQAVARTVSLSHRNVPRAFVLIKVACDRLQERLERLMAETETMVGLPECVIKAVAGLRDRFPRFFGSYEEGRGFRPAPAAHVGVTVDVGKGLSIPVVRDAAGKSLVEIADRLMDFRIHALRESFKEEDLLGGTISLSVNNDKDVLFALPIILPSEVCMLSLGSLQEEPAVVDGALGIRTCVSLGLAYDHRVINGFDAVQFLQAVKAVLEAPDEGLWR